MYRGEYKRVFSDIQLSFIIKTIEIFKALSILLQILQ